MHHKTHLWLGLARELGERPDEVARRTSISRAYYAAYHRCIDWEKELPVQGSENGRKGVHAQLIARLQHPGKGCSRMQSQRSKAIGKLLLEQRERRVTADYRVDDPLPDLLVAAQLNAATRVLRECDKPLRRAKEAPRRHPGRRT